MKKVLLSLAVFSLMGAASAQSEPIKMSKSGICHKPNSTYYNRTKNYTPYPTLQACLNAGGRLPQK